MRHAHTATDKHTVNTRMLVEAAQVTPQTVCNSQAHGVLVRGKRRPHVRGIWWTPNEANKFLRLRGHIGPWFAE